MSWTKRVLVAGIVAALLAGCGSSVRPRTTATFTRPASTPVATATSSTAGRQSTGLEPDGVSFWDAKNGLVVATVTTPACVSGSAACPGGVIERTADGGLSWQVVERADAALNAVTTAGDGVAWVSEARCAAASPDACSSDRLLQTSDGGITWKQIIPATPVSSVAPISATTAWAVAGASRAVLPTGTTLVYSTDSGRVWQTKPNPCAGIFGLALWSVGFDGPRAGWVVCTTQPASDLQPKALLRTANAGSTWTLQAATGFILGQQGRDVGTMSAVGYLPGTQLLADGYGWQWTDRFGLAATTDAGRVWTQIAPNIVVDDINAVTSATLVSDRQGFLLIDHPENRPNCTPSGCGPQLLATRDGGTSWKLITTWPTSN